MFKFLWINKTSSVDTRDKTENKIRNLRCSDDVQGLKIQHIKIYAKKYYAVVFPLNICLNFDFSNNHCAKSRKLKTKLTAQLSQLNIGY